MQRRARYHTCRAERASCHSACTSPLPWAPAFFTPLLRKLRLERSSSQMANGLQRAAQAPPPAELDDVFVIASQRFLRPPRTCCAAEFQTGVCRHGVILDRVSRFCPLAHFRCALKPDLRLGRQTRRTRRSFTSGTPRDLFGSIGLMATHYCRADLTGPEPATGVVRGCRSRRI